MQNQMDNSAKTARERMDADRSRGQGAGGLPLSSIRNRFIELFGLALWIALAVGLLITFWQLITLQILTAAMTVMTTVISVGAGFVVLDIRERLIAKS